MARKPYLNHRGAPAEEAPPEPSPALAGILAALQSPEAAVRAQAVRSLCPCRGTAWEQPVFQRVLALRNDPSPVVRQAVEHDLRENPDWGERAEARRMEAPARAAGHAASTGGDRDRARRDGAGRTQSRLAAPRRPRCRKAYYPRGR